MTAVSLCPYAGAWYAQVTQPALGDVATVNQTVVRAGMAAGAWLVRTPTSRVIVWIMPALLYSRVHLAGVGGDTRNSAEAGGTVGLTFGTGRKIFGASLGGSTMRDSHPVLGLRVGMLVGGKR